MIEYHPPHNHYSTAASNHLCAFTGVPHKAGSDGTCSGDPPIKMMKAIVFMSHGIPIHFILQTELAIDIYCMTRAA